MLIKDIKFTDSDLKEISKKLSIDADLFEDVQDPSEIARFLSKKDYTEIILKYPLKNDISTLGVYLKKDTMVLIHNDDFPIEVNNELDNPYLVLTDILYKITEIYFKAFKNIDKKIKKIKSSAKTRVKNSDLLSLFELQNTLDDYVMSTKGNLLVIGKLAQVIPNNELVGETKIEIEQALETAVSYSKTVSNLKGTLEIITNNTTNKRMESLTIVNVSALIITSISGLYGMNVRLPFADNYNVFYWLLFGGLGLATTIGLFLQKRFADKK